MRNLWKISFILLLGTVLACEGRRRDQPVCPPVDQAAVQTSQTTKPVPTKAEPKTEAPQVTLSAKVVPEPVKYNTEEVAAGIFDNPASKEEAKEDDLKKIKEDAIRRLQARSQKTAALNRAENPEVHESKAPEKTVEKVEKNRTETTDTEAAAGEASPTASAKAETADVSPDGKKNLRAAESLFQKARALTTQGKPQEARKLYLSACQHGHVESCHKFAWHQEQMGNKANAVRFYKAACDRGLTKSCNNLAFHFERQKEWDKALDLYSKACMAKHQLSCTSIRRVNELKSH